MKYKKGFCGDHIPKFPTKHQQDEIQGSGFYADAHEHVSFPCLTSGSVQKEGLLSHRLGAVTFAHKADLVLVHVVSARAHQLGLQTICSLHSFSW